MNVAEIPELPFLKVTFRKDLDVLVARWASAVTPEQLYEGYRHTLAVSKRHNVSLWVMDLRLRNVSTQAEKVWFLKNFVPAVSESLRPTYVAYLSSPYQFAKFSELYPTKSAFNFSKQLQVSFFINEKDAFDWLSTFQVKA